MVLKLNHILYLLFKSIHMNLDWPKRTKPFFFLLLKVMINCVKFSVISGANILNKKFIFMSSQHFFFYIHKNIHTQNEYQISFSYRLLGICFSFLVFVSSLLFFFFINLECKKYIFFFEKLIIEEWRNYK